MARILLVLLLLCCAMPAAAEEDTLTNMPPTAPRGVPGLADTPGSFGPGATILLPDGRQTIIEEILPDGQWRTGIGLIVPPAGVVLVQPATPERKILTPGQVLPTQPAQETPAAPEVVVEESGAATPKVPQVQKSEGNALPEKTPESAPGGAKPQYYTLAELLPRTEAPEEKKETAPEKKEVKPGAKQPAKREQKPERKEPKPEKKVEKKAERPRVGQELRIPEQAAKTGNLDFLEGCWQGTRPEYYSKRTIKECFCFGAGGKTGKRRVFDFSQGRTCIGGSHASLSAGGVLTVVSSGAACNDGERWGQAEMVCRNSGPRTPCSWVFRDAQNGRQSYEIPFVRVESCGR